MSASAGYVHGYNGRAPALSVLIIEPRADALHETVARYLDRCSFVMAALPAQAASASRMFAFDGIVVPPGTELPAAFVGARVIERDDPLAVARELRAVALARRPRPIRA